jgi:hypothetical protein
MCPGLIVLSAGKSCPEMFCKADFKQTLWLLSILSLNIKEITEEFTSHYQKLKVKRRERFF